MQDYLVYFLTLSISVGMFYAFNSVASQPALQNLGATKQLLSDQMGVLISALSVVVSFVLAFLILYANRFLLRRRKKELGIYLLLGMKKGRISRIFAGETLCVGVVSLVLGIALGLALSQGLSLLALRLFAVDMSAFQMVFSMRALKNTSACFVIIFLIVIVLNVRAVASVQLIDLLTANRKNEALRVKNKVMQFLLLVISILCIAASGFFIERYGILPSRETAWFQIAMALLATGTILFFYSISAVLLARFQANPHFYCRGLNAFLCRQIGSKIQTDFWTLAVVCGLLTVSICGLCVGVSSAITMNENAKAALPFDLNVMADVDIAGDTDISQYLQSRDVDISLYALEAAQISLYDADLTYGELFEGQEVSLWPIDASIPQLEVSVITLSDFNRSMQMQGKAPVELGERSFLINCNYKGTLEYIKAFLHSHRSIELGGMTLYLQSAKPLTETYWMTSVGNNDRGTLVVPDASVRSLQKDANVLLVRYRSDTPSNDVLQKMIPIGLEWESEGYRYTEKNMLNDLYYGFSALLVFLCSYVGLVFLLVCAALLSLKQLTETADNIYRYGLLQKLGAPDKWLFGALCKQIAVFFLAPLAVAAVFSAVGIQKITAVIAEFMNMHIASHIGFTLLMFLVLYGGYFLATYLSCKRMILDRRP